MSSKNIYTRAKCSCIICKTEISVNNLQSHFNSDTCKNGKTNAPKQFPKDSLICPFCNKECKSHNSMCQHAIRCKLNPDRKVIKGNTNKRSAWNKGLTKHTDERIAKGSKTLSDNIRSGKTVMPPQVPKSKEVLEKLSRLARERGLGGVRNSKKIEYNGVKLGSSYEVELAKSLDANNIQWIIPKRFHYIDPFGKQRTYTPDFYLPEYNVYLDPKNDFLINNINPHLGFKDSEKIQLVEQQNNIIVLILDKNNLTWDKISKVLDTGFEPAMGN